MNIEQTKTGYPMGREHGAAGVVDPKELFYLFRNNLGKIGLCTLLAIGLTGLYLEVTRPVYTSTALLEVVQAQNPNATEVDTLDNLKTIELKIAARPILLGVIREKHLVDDPEFATREESGALRGSDAARWVKSTAQDLSARISGSAPSPVVPEKYSETELAKRLSSQVQVSVLRGSRLIAVSAEAHTAEKAQQLAQAVIREFFRQSQEGRSRDSASARELMLAEANRLGAELKASEEKLEAYRAKYNAVSLQERQNIVVERLRDLNQQVASAKNARFVMEAEQERVRRLADSDPDQLLSIRSIAELPEILDLRKQVTLQDAQLATLSQRYGPLHPTMIQARSQLEELQGALHRGLRKACERLFQSYESVKATEVALEGSLAEQEKAALELDRIAIPYHALEHETQANAAAYQKVLGDLKQSDVSHGLVSSNDVDGIDIRVVEDAPVPSRPTSPRRQLLLGISAALGLFLGCGLTLATRALDSSLSSVDEAEAYLGIGVLASVPRTHHRQVRGEPMIVRFPASAQAEAFRSLRTTLSMLDGAEDRRCIVLTSAVPAEGKSFCSVNCAAAFALQGKRTLLIDGDLRRPSLHQMFGGTGPGLTECLRDPAQFSRAVRGTTVENLFWLGDVSHQPGCAELLGQGRMRDIIRLGLETHDQIVIDTAPLLAVSDTLFIARDVTTVCLVAQAEKTPRRMIRRAIRLLEEVGRRRPAGVILNKINSRASADHYYYYNA